MAHVHDENCDHSQDNPFADLDEETQREIQEIQMLEQSFQQLLMQKQAFQYETTETDNALEEVKKATQEISLGNLTYQIIIQKDDEIGELSQNINAMNKSIKEAKENIEKKVSERTKELEDLNKFMTGRELKMMELKQEIEKLKA